MTSEVLGADTEGDARISLVWFSIVLIMSHRILSAVTDEALIPLVGSLTLTFTLVSPNNLLDKITVLEATVEMYMHPEQHTVNSAALLYEVYNDMGKLDLE
ncbi:hypothetical protein Tco_0745507 [Tanacetum coccineum]